MSATPTYLSFDFENDRRLKEFVIGQTKLPGSELSIIDHSIKEEVQGDWVADAERRIKRSELVLVIVGPKSHCAQGVLKEVALAKKHGKRIAQLIGYKDSNPTPVPGAGPLYRWTKETLHWIIKG